MPSLTLRVYVPSGRVQYITVSGTMIRVGLCGNEQCRQPRIAGIDTARRATAREVIRGHRSSAMYFGLEWSSRF